MRKNLPLKMGEKNLNKDFSNTRRGGVTILRKFFSKFYIFLNDGFPNTDTIQHKSPQMITKEASDWMGIMF